MKYSEVGSLIGWRGDGDIVAAGNILEDFWCCRGSAWMSVNSSVRSVDWPDFPPSANATMDIVSAVVVRLPL